MFCVESGDLFSFVAGKDERDAAKEYIFFRIMRLRGATLGEEVIVRVDYRGKKLAVFKTEEILSSFASQHLLRWQKIGDRIHFLRTHIPRRSRFEAWQDIYRKGEPMKKLKKCHWIAQGYRRNPVTGEML